MSIRRPTSTPQQAGEPDSAAPFLRLRATDGDFPHTHRRSVRLACCCCTTCCFTLLLGGIGGIAGAVVGIVKAAKATPPAPNEPRSELASFGLGFTRFLVYLVAYCLAGLLLGAAIGFGIDVILLPHL